MTENEYLELPWSVEDTIENLETIKEIMIAKVRAVNLDGKAKSDVEEIEFDFSRALSALREIQQYRAIGAVEECREARERQRAKKPIKTPDCSDCKKECNKDCISFNYGEIYLCPTCHQNAIFNSEYDVFYKHCLNCGQKLDWSE